MGPLFLVFIGCIAVQGIARADTVSAGALLSPRPRCCSFRFTTHVFLPPGFLFVAVQCPRLVGLAGLGAAGPAISFPQATALSLRGPLIRRGIRALRDASSWHRRRRPARERNRSPTNRAKVAGQKQPPPTPHRRERHGANRVLSRGDRRRSTRRSDDGRRGTLLVGGLGSRLAPRAPQPQTRQSASFRRTSSSSGVDFVRAGLGTPLHDAFRHRSTIPRRPAHARVRSRFTRSLARARKPLTFAARPSIPSTVADL